MSTTQALEYRRRSVRLKWAIIAALVCLVFAFFFSSSNDDVYGVTVSPDHAYVARVAFKETAEIESARKFVFVRPVWLPFDNRITSCRAFQAYGEDKILLNWKDKDHLEVRHGFPKPEIHFVATACYGISISAVFDQKLGRSR